MKPHKCPVCEGSGVDPFVGSSSESMPLCRKCNGNMVIWEPEDTKEVRFKCCKHCGTTKSPSGYFINSLCSDCWVGPW